MDAKQAAIAVVFLVDSQVAFWAHQLMAESQGKADGVDNKLIFAMELRDAVEIKEVAPIYG